MREDISIILLFSRKPYSVSIEMKVTRVKTYTGNGCVHA